MTQTITPEFLLKRMQELFNEGESTMALAAGLFYLADRNQGDFFETPELNGLYATILLHEGQEKLFMEYLVVVQNDPHASEDLKLDLTRDYANWLNRTRQYAKAELEIDKLHAAVNRPPFKRLADELIEAVGWMLRNREHFEDAHWAIRQAYLKGCKEMRNPEVKPTDEGIQYVMNLRFWLMIADCLVFTIDAHAVKLAKQLLSGTTLVSAKEGEEALVLKADPNRKRQIIAKAIQRTPQLSRYFIGLLVVNRYRLK